MRHWLTLAVLLLSGPASGQLQSWPGGVVRIDLGPAEDAAPVVQYQDKPVLVATVNGRWEAVVGLHLDTPPGTVAVQLAEGSERSITVVEHDYREQHLTVAPSYVSLSEENLARVGRERKIIDAALNNWREQTLQQVTLQAPVAGRRSASFGSRRFFNGEPRAPHSGMDIAANSGVVINTPLAGVVTAVGDYYFNGNTVIVDHGQGFITMYCHLSEVSVDEGQSLLQGEPLGKVGATGRVTGAHLHFGTYLNGNAVDPALLLAETEP